MARMAWFNIPHDSRTTARYANVVERGAVVNGDQTVAAGGTLTVHAGHDFAANDKALFCVPTRDRFAATPVELITASAATSLTLTYGGSFPDKSILVNVGADSGGTLLVGGTWSDLEWDAAAVTIYEDPNGDSAITNSRVTVVAGARISYWAPPAAHWVVMRDTRGRPVGLHMDTGFYASQLMQDTSEGTAAASNRGMFRFVAGTSGVADQVLICLKNKSDTYNFVLLADGGE